MFDRNSFSSRPTIPDRRIPGAYASLRARRIRRIAATSAVLALTFGAGAATALLVRPLFVSDGKPVTGEPVTLAHSDIEGGDDIVGEEELAEVTFEEPEPAEPELVEETIVLQRNDTFSAALKRAGVDDAQAHALITALSGKVDFRRVRPGHKLILQRDEEGRIASAVFTTSPIDFVDVVATDTGFEASERELDLVTRQETVSVTIESSLWDAFVKAEEDPALATLASDVLAWEIDFYRDVRRGDRLDMVVERITHEDQLVSYGKLLAVKYEGEMGQKELYRWDYDGTTGWFDTEGRSARRPFLKQPLPLVRITSGFGGRRHPILGYYREHLGVDYGAPTGTPVWAVGDGVVTWAGWKGANGNLITIRHSNGYTSHYAHLSRVHVKKGERVTQKQVIGRVGSTGRSTGPHLHFALSRAGKFVNPLTVKFPAGDPLPASQREAFAAAIEPLSELLHSNDVMMARQ